MPRILHDERAEIQSAWKETALQAQPKSLTRLTLQPQTQTDIETDNGTGFISTNLISALLLHISHLLLDQLDAFHLTGTALFAEGSAPSSRDLKECSFN